MKRIASFVLNGVGRFLYFVSSITALVTLITLVFPTVIPPHDYRVVFFVFLAALAYWAIYVDISTRLRGVLKGLAEEAEEYSRALLAGVKHLVRRKKA